MNWVVDGLKLYLLAAVVLFAVACVAYKLDYGRWPFRKLLGKDRVKVRG